MTVATTWTVKIGDQVLTDITDTVLGFSVNQPIEIRQHTAHTARLTLDNNDGRYTPGAGGTFTSFDWFNKMVRITATVGSYTAAVYDGFIDSFDINDDGLNSVVDISAIDALSLAGRAPMRSAVGTQGFIPTDMIRQLYLRMQSDGYLPDFGGSPATTPIYLYDRDSVYPHWARELQLDTVAGGTPVSGRVIGDEINNRVGASDYFVFWQQGIEPGYPGQFTSYYYCLVGLIGTRQESGFDYGRDVSRYTFTFTEDTPGAGELPFRSLKREFTIDRLVNDIDQASEITSTDVQFTDSVSTGRYGVRSVSFTSAINQTDADMRAAAQNHLNRFSDVSFVPTQAVVTSSMVYDKCGSGSEEAWSNLLDAGRGMYQLAHVVYTPAGTSTQQDDLLMLMGRTIRATPEDVSVTLTFRPASQLVSLELDNTEIGVLGGTLDTYDTSSFTYDTPLLRYEGRPEDGMRLG